MGRPVVLSNGQLFVGLDEYGLVHDFYYPYVGLDNLTSARNPQHKIGVWVDGAFAWVSDGSWEVSIDFEDGALISDIRMHSPSLQLTLAFKDFVDCEYNALVRRVTVVNEHEASRDIRLFMHQAFQISRAGRADTALYVPGDNYILDYKGRCCLLISGRFAGDGEFDQFAVGNYNIEGKEGTYKDAEDGELSGNAVEHGGVDTVIRFRRQVEGKSSSNIDYWVVAADSQQDALGIHAHFKYYSVDDRLEATREYFKKWLAPAHQKLQEVPERYRRETQKSLLIIKAHCDDRGSILASGDSSIFNFGRDYYCYCWPRDAAYAIWPLIRFGLFDEARKFFDFVRATMHHDGYLMHKYQPDRAIGSTWHPLLHGNHRELAIQEDETAIVLFMMGEYYRASKDTTFVEEYYENFIEPCASFMTSYVDESTGLPHASYDLWEQKFLTSTYTVCTVIAALETSIAFAKAIRRDNDVDPWRRAADRMRSNLQMLYHPTAGYFRKGFMLEDNGDITYDDTLDISSMYGPYMFADLPLDDARLQNTFDKVTHDLLDTAPIGGVIRYPGDNYFLAKSQFKGNPWIVCTLWLAQYLHANKQPDKAKALLDWGFARRLSSGVLSEQFDPETGYAISVAPLVWSHAEFINTVLDLHDIK